MISVQESNDGIFAEDMSVGTDIITSTTTELNGTIATDAAAMKHPLPEDIANMPEDDTTCKFCGVSYLIHSEMNAMKRHCKELDAKLIHYQGYDEREKKYINGLEVLEKDSAEQRAYLSDAKTTIEELKADLINQQAINASQEIDVNKTRDKLTASERTREAQVFLISDQLKKVSLEATTMREMLNKVRGGIQSSIQDYFKSAITADMGLAKELLAHISAVNVKHGKSMASSAHACETISKHLEVLQEEKGVLIERCDELQSNIDIHQEEKNNLRIDCASFAARTCGYESKIEELSAQLIYKEKSIKELVLATGAEKEERHALERQIKLKDTELLALNKKLEKAEELLRESVSDKSKDIQKLHDDAAGALKRITELEKELGDGVTSHQAQLYQLQRNQELTVEAAVECVRNELTTKVERLTEELEIAQCNIVDSNSLKKELESEREKRDQVEKNILIYIEDVNILKRNILEKEQDMSKLRSLFEAEKSRSENGLHASASRVTELEQQISSMRQRAEISSKMGRDDSELEAVLASKEQEIAFLMDTVHKECEERQELTATLQETRERLACLGRVPGHPSYSKKRQPEDDNVAYNYRNSTTDEENRTQPTPPHSEPPEEASYLKGRRQSQATQLLRSRSRKA